eukprot:TRINITY_DN13098_c0_g1_i3.p1 TRINITY_DN13098_c0_g1~~TRINITY_DN13098_c0_g1_i3.p1  ORF type:complete len:197 (+),score=45.61 TRINITY_DN13098_c0_g1_i3:925-1515(+)
MMGLCGCLIYRTHLTRTSWRVLFAVCGLIQCGFSSMQLMLVSRDNERVGLSDFWFALGDDAATALVEGLQTLPFAAMLITMCPRLQEGSSFALFTTFINLSGPMSRVCGVMVSNIWDCSNRAMEMQDFTGLWNVVAVTTVLSLLSLSLVQYLPKSSEESMIMHTMGQQSEFHAQLFIAVFGASMLVVVLDTLYELG